MVFAITCFCNPIKPLLCNVEKNWKAILTPISRRHKQIFSFGIICECSQLSAMWGAKKNKAAMIDNVITRYNRSIEYNKFRQYTLSSLLLANSRPSVSDKPASANNNKVINTV